MDLQHLADTLKGITFHGNEVSHPPSKIIFTYSPGRIDMSREDLGKERWTQAFEFDNGYHLLSYENDVPGNGPIKVYSSQELKQMRRFGVDVNHFRRDPRYVLTHMTDVQQIDGCTHTMRIYDQKAREMEEERKALPKGLLKTLSGVVHAVTIHTTEDFIRKMVVHNRWPSGKETRFADIEFYR